MIYDNKEFCTAGKTEFTCHDMHQDKPEDTFVGPFSKILSNSFTKLFSVFRTSLNCSAYHLKS